MVDPFVLLVAVVILTLAFDYVNGFHDTANAIATVVSTNVLPPRTAVLVAAVFNFAGAFLGTGVAKTIGGDIASPDAITQTVVLAALGGAITWNLITWYFGIPSSSSHALVGGIVGAALTHQVVDGGKEFGSTLGTLMTSGGVTKVLVGLVVSPLAGLVVGFIIMIALYWIVRGRAPGRVTNLFRRLQLVSASAMALSHGSNDAQKAMGIVTMALVAYYANHPAEVPAWLDMASYHASKGKQLPNVPMWVIVACATAMALGTSAGGWRIMKTMGHKIIKLRPINGFAAETAGAAVILGASILHAPVSTTHVISSAIMGVGASNRVSAVRWGLAGNIMMAWVLTIPISALVAAVTYFALRVPFGA